MGYKIYIPVFLVTARMVLALSADPSDCNEMLGMADGRIHDEQISASSEYDATCAAQNGRLNIANAWCPQTNDNNQWLQVNLGALTNVTAIATQGRASGGQWVTQYTVSYTADNVEFEDYAPSGTVKEFVGNSDSDTVVEHELIPPIVARYIRIHPTGAYAWRSMRVGFKGCSAGCVESLGMEDGLISDGQIWASSEDSATCAAQNGRLNGPDAWCAAAINGHQWLQVDFGTLTKVAGIETQGREDYSQWVTSYTVSYSEDNVDFEDYKQSGKVKNFPGNEDSTTVAKNQLQHAILARYIRLNPKKWYGAISMRVAFEGCLAACSARLGMESGSIADEQISASSEWDATCAAQNGRLNSANAWCPKTNDNDQWLQVNFVALTNVTAIATQGRATGGQWVTQYTVSYGVGGSYFEDYEENGDVKEFVGNSDSNTIVQHQLSPSILARSVRINPTGAYGWRSMRVGFRGCLAACSRSSKKKRSDDLEQSEPAPPQYLLR